jgi:hypothetical protein
VLIGLSGFEHHGPRGHVGFAPRITPDRFRSAFTAAEGWGTLSQSRAGRTQTSEVAVRWGRLRVVSVSLELPDHARLAGTAVTLAGRPVAASAAQDGRRVTLSLDRETVIDAGSSLTVALRWQGRGGSS